MTTTTILLKNGTILVHDEDEKNVTVLRNTDLLIQNDRITHIAQNIDPADYQDTTTTLIDCTDKIISPGFTDTHHHVWQTQLKGRHADETLLDYYPSGNFQHNHYSARDVFWGQLAGAMEAIDCGTTFILDHAHGCTDEEKAEQAIAGSLTSGIRSVFAYCQPIFSFKKWDMQDIQMRDDLGGPNAAMDYLERIVKGKHHGDGRVTFGLAFDEYYLPEEMVKDVFARAAKAGMNVITSHVVDVPMFASGESAVKKLERYGLLNSTPKLVLSHCTNLSEEDYDILSKTQTAISSTPETDAQMALGNTVLLQPGLKVSVGVDCHTNNTSFMPQLARTGMYCARERTNHEALAKGKWPNKIRGTTQQLFNAVTVEGADAVGMLSDIGSLRVGKKADVVIFDTKSSTSMSCVAETDPLAAVVRHSGVRDVDTVIVDGIVRKRDGKLCPVVQTSLFSGSFGSSHYMSWEEVREHLIQSTKDIHERDAQSSRQLAREMVMKVMGTDEKLFVDIE